MYNSFRELKCVNRGQATWKTITTKAVALVELTVHCTEHSEIHYIRHTPTSGSVMFKSSHSVLANSSGSLSRLPIS